MHPIDNDELFPAGRIPFLSNRDDIITVEIPLRLIIFIRYEKDDARGRKVIFDISSHRRNEGFGKSAHHPPPGPPSIPTRLEAFYGREEIGHVTAHPGKFLDRFHAYIVLQQFQSFISP